MRRGRPLRAPGGRLWVPLLASLCLMPAACGEESPTGSEALPEGTRVTVTGHQQVSLEAGGPVPLFLGDRLPRLCLAAPPGVDTSQWQADLRWEGGTPPPTPGPQDGRAESPTVRLERGADPFGSVLCFEARWPEMAPDGPGRKLPSYLCGSVVDRYDGRRFRLPCRPLLRSPETSLRDALMGRMGRAVAERHGSGPETFHRTLAELAREARQGDLPWLAVRFRLVSVHFRVEEGDRGLVAGARRLLEDLPGWLRDPAATGLHADATYLRGTLHLRRLEDTGEGGGEGESELPADGTGPGGTSHLEAAWAAFRQAEDLYLRSLDRKRLAAVRGQAEVLARVGAVDDAIHRLDAALEGCASVPCSDIQASVARGLRAWLVLLDTGAGPGQLERAVEELRQVAESPGVEAQERANHLINLALLQARQGEDPSATLSRARGLVPAAPGSHRAALLASWSRLAEALYRLEESRGGSAPPAGLERAETLCEAMAREAPTQRLTAWASSCLGRVHHRRGDLERAARAFDRALAFHQQATPEQLGRLLPLGPGQRADDHYRAARVALELGEPERAWEILQGLDRAPAAGGATARSSPEGVPEWRAFPLEDEALLLRRDREGRVSLVRRTALDPGELRPLLDRVVGALEERRLSDPAWRRLVAPLARALVPPGLPSGGGGAAVLPYSLHGRLQWIPLEALPVPRPGAPSPGGNPPPWLGDLATVAVLPAAPAPGSDPAPGARVARLPAGRSEPLVILDPKGDLGSASRLAPPWRELFPGSRVLAGGEATVERFRQALPRASWLHADTHGSYDPAFPERSSLVLADGEIRIREVATLPLDLEFANLSGCRTGTWPAGAGSGRYGMGGLLARRGARWVVASRTDLLNRLALDFNPLFYAALAEGEPVPAAYGRAMGRLRGRYPATTWAALFLIRGPGRADGPGQIARLATPFPMTAEGAFSCRRARVAGSGGRGTPAHLGGSP